MSLIIEFVQEAREYIDEVEPTLIEIYNGDENGATVDHELINSVFRLFHSMKGSAGFLALDTIASVTHEAESLLDKIRNGELILTVEITETLCKTLDLFRKMLDVIVETGEDKGFDEEAKRFIANLKTHSEGTPSLTEATSASSEFVSQTETPALPSDISVSVSLAETTKILTPEMQATPTNEIPPQNTEKTVAASNLSEETIESPSISQVELEENSIQLSPEMRLGFVQEGNEQIDGVEQSLLRVLEDKGAADELFKEAFRCIHSFKGNCGFMGFVDLEQLSHAMETFLDMLRIGTVAAENTNISQLLSLLDVLREGVNSVESGGGGKITNCDAHVNALNEIMMINGDSSMQETLPLPTNQAAPPQGNKTSAAPPNETAPAVSAPVKTPAAPPSTASKGSAAKQDIRVDLHKLDSLINLVGELVIAESMVTRCPAVSYVEDEYYNRAKHQLRRICDDLKDVAMAVRMIPLSATFRKMIRLVHDLATKSGKKIKLNIVGEETEVDKTVIEQIADPLVHIVRNSCDHGIESPETRIAKGKPEMGTVTLEGRHEGGEVWILITDDGRGLNKETIVSKALEKGIVGAEVKDWSDDRIYRLIFEAGFSTAEKITDISGRGVGMDVVRKNIEKLNGRIDIQTREGQGSTFILRIPLTLAIIDSMLVRVGTAKYMIPTLAILESLVPSASQVTVTPDGKEILRLRDEMIPIIRLYDIFAQQPDSARLKDGILIVAEDNGQQFAIFVDEIVGQQQAVIKGLPDYIGKADGFSGCTILGDGTVSLIIDVGTISQKRGTFAASPCNKNADWDDVPPPKPNHETDAKREMTNENLYKFDEEHEDVPEKDHLETIRNLRPEEIERMNPEDISWEMLEASVGTVAK
ncbi:MAG: chemotaxis protein CheA [Planctomycetaceae bacterium]|nr:chemotaxis protein CheA [Planctomycetaceae bacterium]